MLIIFDWDGTLCDSAGEIVVAMQEAADLHRLPSPSEEAVRNIIGLSLPVAIGQLFPMLEDALIEAVAESYSERFRAHAQESRLYDGAEETLEGLLDRGYQLAIATGKSRRGLDRVLNSLDMADWFHASRCADETRSKPHPQMLEEILLECRRAPAEAVMIGDTEYDLEMASLAGVPSVGVSFGMHETQRLEAHDPVAIIDALPELLDLEHLKSSA